jgi:hypothetical protein
MKKPLKRKKCKDCLISFIPYHGSVKFCPECQDRRKKKLPIPKEATEQLGENYEPTVAQKAFIQVVLLNFGRNLNMREKCEKAEIATITVSKWFYEPGHENFRIWYKEQIERRMADSVNDVIDAVTLNATGQATKDVVISGEIRTMRIDRSDQNKAAEIILKTQGRYIDRQVSQSEKKILIETNVRKIPLLEDLDEKVIDVHFTEVDKKEEKEDE